MVDAQTVGVLVTAASVSVAAIYYVMTLRSQQRNMKATLQTREAQLFMTLHSNTSSEEFSRHLINIHSAKWNSYEDFKAKIINDPKKAVSLQVIVSTWEGIGVLVRENLIDVKLIALYCAWPTRRLWEKFRRD
jgi:predicted Holliday junction resolvase-like endonuclease